MARNPFTVLGVDENVTSNELYEAYRNLRNRYADLRFEPGDVGNDACIRLEEIEAAYTEARDIISNRSKESNFSGGLDDAEQAIREKRMNDAQIHLDNCTVRSARWHYLQSSVYYGKDRLSDAIKQMEFACAKEPLNEKYAETKRLMLEEMLGKHASTYGAASARSTQYNNQNNGGRRSYQDNYDDGRSPQGCTVCQCCQGLICADCCCQCMGGSSCC